MQEQNKMFCGELASRQNRLILFLYGAAVKRDEAKRNRACMAVLPLYHPCGAAYFRMIASATFIPSIAADVIPPAYPAPSPQG